MPSLYAEVVARFVDDTAGNFAKLRSAIAAGDLRLTHQTAHSLKGLAAMCGAVGVESILDEIETAGREEDSELVADCSVRLKLAMDATRIALTPYRQTGTEGNGIQISGNCSGR
jgi:HPt (histidine-containing phosphotransfer) domain-containing protein